jgi:O-antigen/teichoic acid export membrane protein
VAVCTFPYGQFLSNLRALMSEGRTARAALTTLVAATVNIGLNIAMVPLFGITGSAVATVASYTLLAWLTRPPAASGLTVPGITPAHGAAIGCAVIITAGMAFLPLSREFILLRAAIFLGAALAFMALLRRAASGFGAPC